MSSAKCFAVTALIALGMLVTASAQEQGTKPRSLAQRLKAVTHLVLQNNPQTGLYTAMLYSAEEANEMVKQQAEGQGDEAAIREQIESLQLRLQEARASNASQVEASQLMRELAQAQRRLGETSLRNVVYRVVEVGTDFVEVESLNEPKQIAIIPFQRIGRFVVKRAVEGTPK